MRHPIEKYNQIQAERLAAIPEEKREDAALLYRISNAAYCYHQQFNGVTGLPENDSPLNLPEDLSDWLEQRIAGVPDSHSANELLQIYFEEYLEGLSNDRLREVERTRGLAEARRSWPFRRYVLERHDFGLEEFMRLNLSETDYGFWKSLSDAQLT